MKPLIYCSLLCALLSSQASAQQLPPRPSVIRLDPQEMIRQGYREESPGHWTRLIDPQTGQVIPQLNMGASGQFSPAVWAPDPRQADMSCSGGNCSPGGMMPIRNPGSQPFSPRPAADSPASDASCQPGAPGPRGPAGANGAPGPAGPQGERGAAGEITQAHLDAIAAQVISYIQSNPAQFRGDRGEQGAPGEPIDVQELIALIPPIRIEAATPAGPPRLIGEAKPGGTILLPLTAVLQVLDGKQMDAGQLSIGGKITIDRKTLE